MKPYGRYKTVKGAEWKQDHRIRKFGRKIGNWWEGICDLLPRKTMKQRSVRQQNKDEQ